jgi:hypothetical protein
MWRTYVHLAKLFFDTTTLQIHWLYKITNKIISINFIKRKLLTWKIFFSTKNSNLILCNMKTKFWINILRKGHWKKCDVVLHKVCMLLQHCFCHNHFTYCWKWNIFQLHINNLLNFENIFPKRKFVTKFV